MADKLQLNNRQLKRLAELLMGAAHADTMYDGDEAEAIGDILRGVVAPQGLPPEVTSHIARFDVDDLDLIAAGQDLALNTPGERAAIFALLMKVIDADEIHDQAESAFLRRVGQALGADPSEYEHLTFEIVAIEPI